MAQEDIIMKQEEITEPIIKVVDLDENQKDKTDRLKYLNEKFEGHTVVQIIQNGKEKIHEMFSSGKSNDVFYIILSGFLMKTENGASVWKGDEEIDSDRLEAVLKRIKQEEAFNRGKQMLTSLYEAGKSNSKKYIGLHHLLAENFEGNLKWKNVSDINAEELEIVLDTVDSPIADFVPETEERVIETPEMLNEREVSKKFFAEERKRLAEEIRTERNRQRERLDSLKEKLEVGSTLEGTEADKQYGELSDLHSAEANNLSGRLSSSGGIDEQGAVDERENVSTHIDNSERLKLLQAEVKELYTKAGEKAREDFESIQKSVEQVLLRNKAFIVHTFLLDERLRHNDNSNILGRATLEDDINILLSLEPSISTSSVIPGIKQGLWGGRIGVVLGGGDIRGVAQIDDGTVTGGIKGRTGVISSPKEIDEKVGDKSERSYNELVVNNPKAFGFFINVQMDGSGKFFDFEVDKNDKTGRAKKDKDQFMSYVNLSTSKGLPPLVMTPDRRLFEFINIGDDGVISVGKEITPEQVAKGNAGIANEKRKVIGNEVISKNLFRYIEDQKQAKEVLGELSGQKNAEGDLSIEEYASYLKDNPGSFRQLPKHLLDDKEFMMKNAYTESVSAYENAGEELKRDIEFIRHIYSLRSTEDKRSVYYLMPDDLKKNQEMALLAIEHDDLDHLDSSFSEVPSVWEKIIDKIIDKSNPSETFSREVGKSEVRRPHLSVYSSDKKSLIDLSNKLISDTSFVGKLNSKYSNFKFEIYNGDSVLVTKLA